jgi:hypothetical protein
MRVVDHGCVAAADDASSAVTVEGDATSDSGRPGDAAAVELVAVSKTYERGHAHRARPCAR